MRQDRLPSLLLANLSHFVPGFYNTNRIPVLMYHSISKEQENGHPYYHLNTSPDKFREQMNFLKQNKYETISLSDISAYYNTNSISSKKAVCITFDDGFRDFYTEAFPILNEYNQKAIMYIPVKYIGNIFLRKSCMSWAQIKELSNSGIEFGSHTMSHPFLRTLNDVDLEKELGQSRDIIEQKLGKEIQSFSHPYALPETDQVYLKRLKDQLKSSGYKSGVTTIIGTVKSGDDLYFLKRVPVNNCDDLKLFNAKLMGGYNWLHMIQYLNKKIKRSGSGEGTEGQ